MSKLSSLVQVYGNRKMAILLLLGFSSGLPLYLTSRTLQAWLTVEGVDLPTVGLLSLVALPYSLKFVWSPLLDRFSFRRFGRRRGWMGLSQILLIVALAMMALGRPAEGVVFVASVALVIAFLSATQDIAVDAYRVDVLSKAELGAGAGVNVLGYRIAMIWAFAGALFLADRVPWPTVYLVMAACMTVGLAASIRSPEPEDPGTPPESLGDAVREPFKEFALRLGARRTLVVLIFIGIYKLGDNVAGNMTTPFLLETGFTQTAIGAVQGGMGLVATIAGVLVGGALLSRIGILRSLWIFGLLQAGSNFAYLALAQVGPSYPLMVFTINVEYFSQGLGTAALVAFLMSLCNHRFSATQYALLSSFMAFNRDIGSAPAGYLAEWSGWPVFFLITVVLAFPGLTLLWRIRADGETVAAVELRNVEK